MQHLLRSRPRGAFTRLRGAHLRVVAVAVVEGWQSQLMLLQGVPVHFHICRTGQFLPLWQLRCQAILVRSGWILILQRKKKRLSMVDVADTTLTLGPGPSGLR